MKQIKYERKIDADYNINKILTNMHCNILISKIENVQKEAKLKIIYCREVMKNFLWDFQKQRISRKNTKEKIKIGQEK